MDAEMKNAIRATGQEAQYDEKAKRLLSHKCILAYILVKTVDEFKGMSPEDAASYIEGEPLVGIVPIEPGLTNKGKSESGKRLVGFNSENSEINEGLVRFDIVFYVRLKEGLSQMIINVEAQKNLPAEYKILNRAIFYVSRLVSSQKERDFTNMNYDDIKRVFSIWICMDMEENGMTYVHLTDDRLLGSYQWQGRLDLLNIVLIGLADELPGNEEEYGLHRLLGALLSTDLSIDEKLSIIGKEYKIPLEDGIQKGVEAMCNLSQGILERGRKEGRQEGRQEGRKEGEKKLILNMYKRGFTLEQIAEVAEKEVEEVRAVIAEGELAPV